MAATYTSLILCVLVCLPLLVIGEVCTSPQVTDKKVYTTEDAFTATDTAFIIEFTLSCKNGAKNMFLHADIPGKQLPVSRAVDGTNEYQVSWTDEHQKSSRTYVINFYDEDGFSALRKAQRSGEDASAVKPLFVISFDHKGVSSGPYVSTEVLATMTGFLVWYLAYSAKSKIQA
ncbi:translocon-associated protein subunit delta-like isoform X1 [Ptychodera flava]